jgi:HSP20 family protein
MNKPKRSFFEKLTGASMIDDDDEQQEETQLYPSHATDQNSIGLKSSSWMDEEAEEGQLTVDVYESANDIIIKTMVAGVKPEDLDISITREMVTIRGKREEDRTISAEDYFHHELYWGSFSRTIVLPKEVDIEEAEAVEKYGLLILKLPKLDKHKEARLKVKAS